MTLPEYFYIIFLCPQNVQEFICFVKMIFKLKFPIETPNPPLLHENGAEYI